MRSRSDSDWEPDDRICCAGSTVRDNNARMVIPSAAVSAVPLVMEAHNDPRSGRSPTYPVWGGAAWSLGLGAWSLFRPAGDGPTDHGRTKHQVLRTKDQNHRR